MISSGWSLIISTKTCRSTLHFEDDEITVACLFDITKAYDHLWHGGVLLKMATIGLSNSTIQMIMSFLLNRSIRIKINNATSEPITLMSGTPQGSIISATVFNIWVYDIPQPLAEKRTKLSQFADDMASWTKAKDSRTAIRELDRYNSRLTRYCGVWSIGLSTEKTQVVYFSKKRIEQDRKVTVAGQQLTPTEEAEFLGFTLDRNLKLRSHHKKKCTEMRRRIGVLRNICGTNERPRAGTDIGINIMKTMIAPICYYAPTVACTMTDKMMGDYDTLIKRAGRIACHAPKTAAGDYMNRHLNLESSRSVMTKLATRYINNENRSSTVKEIVRKYQTKTIRHDSPLTKISDICAKS